MLFFLSNQILVRSGVLSFFSMFCSSDIKIILHVFLKTFSDICIRVSNLHSLVDMDVVPRRLFTCAVLCKHGEMMM